MSLPYRHMLGIYVVIVVLLGAVYGTSLAAPKVGDAGRVAQGDTAFNASISAEHIKYLSHTVGARFAGTPNEKRAVDYVKAQLDKMGYKTSLQVFLLPDKRKSYNVVAFLPGKSKKSLIVGAHLDSRGGPGANDNASGVGVLLELARIAKAQKANPYPIYFVFFGSEERVGKNPDRHHFGSRYFVKHLSKARRDQMLAMINIDMVGSGTQFHVRSLKKTAGPAAKQLIKAGANSGIKLTYLQAKEDSDFEAFEKVGIDSAWLQWRKDTTWHTPKDTYSRIDRQKLHATGVVLQQFIYNSAR